MYSLGSAWSHGHTIDSALDITARSALQKGRITSTLAIRSQEITSRRKGKGVAKEQITGIFNSILEKEIEALDESMQGLEDGDELDCRSIASAIETPSPITHSPFTTSSASLSPPLYILTTYNIMKAVAGSYQEQEWFKALVSYVTTHATTIIYAPFLIKDDHWVAARYDPSSQKWTYVNSLPSRVIPSKFVRTFDDISAILRTLPSALQPRQSLLSPFVIGQQEDGHSCGYAVINAIEHDILHIPLFSPDRARIIRFTTFLLIGHEDEFTFKNTSARNGVVTYSNSNSSDSTFHLYQLQEKALEANPSSSSVEWLKQSHQVDYDTEFLDQVIATLDEALLLTLLDQEKEKIKDKGKLKESSSSQDAGDSTYTASSNLDKKEENKKVERVAEYMEKEDEEEDEEEEEEESDYDEEEELEGKFLADAMNDNITELRAKAVTKAAADQDTLKLQSDQKLLSHASLYDQISETVSASIEQSNSSGSNNNSRIRVTISKEEEALRLAKVIAEAVSSQDKVTRFQKSILVISSVATFPRQNPRAVRCGLCNKTLLMTHLFKTNLFKLHIHGDGKKKPPSCSQAGSKVTYGRITSLLPPVSASSSSISSSSASLPFRPLSKPLPPPSHTRLPTFRPPSTCPGLSSATHASIDKYLKRTQSEGGGSLSRVQLYRRFLGKKEYQARQLRPAHNRYSTDEQLKIRLLEKEHFTWLNHRDILVVRSVKCLKTSEYGDIPCASCCNLLQNPVFSKSLSRRSVPDKNIKYTPISSRNVSVMELFARQHGLVELIDPSGEFSSVLKVGRAIASGKIKGSEDLCKMFLDVMNSLGEDIRRDEKGFGKQGKKISPALYALCENLSILSPRAYKMVSPLLGGSTNRVFQ